MEAAAVLLLTLSLTASGASTVQVGLETLEADAGALSRVSGTVSFS